MKCYWFATQNELKKLIYRKKYTVLLILGILFNLGSLLLRLLMQRIAGSGDFSGSGTPMGMMTLFVEFYVPLITMMGVCDLFATEYQDGSIKASLLRPVNRFKLYCAKITAVVLLAAGYLTLFWLSGALFDMALLGKTSLPFYALFAYLLNLLPIGIVILMAVFLNQLGKSSTMAMFSCIMIYILLYIAGIFIPYLSGLLFTGYMKWHTLWLGHTLPLGAITAKSALLAGYGLVFFSGGYGLFLKREF